MTQPNAEPNISALMVERGLAPERVTALKLSLTFPFALNILRGSAVRMVTSEFIDPNQVIQLLSSNDFVEKQAGACLMYKSLRNPDGIAKIYAPILTELDKILSDGFLFEQTAAARAKVRLLHALHGPEILVKLMADQNNQVKVAAAETRIRHVVDTKDGQAIEQLQEFIHSPVAFIRQTVAKALEKFDDQVLPVLETLCQDERDLVQSAAANSKIKIILKDKGLEGIKLLVDDPNITVAREAAKVYVKQLVAQNIDNPIPVLEKIASDNMQNAEIIYRAQREIDNFQIRTEGRGDLLSSSTPYLATPYLEDFVKGLETMQELADILKKEFKERFTGLTLIGSRYKGYSDKKSDFEVGIIAEEVEIHGRLRDLIIDRNLKFQLEGLLEPALTGKEDLLFQGIFVGDRERLVALQRAVLKKMTPGQWDLLRRRIMYNSTNFEKAVERFYLDEETMEKVMEVMLLRQIPPSYDDSLAILDRG